MNKFSFAAGTRRITGPCLLMLALAALAGAVEYAQSPAISSSDAGRALLDGFRHVEVASVSDAVEQITGRKMYMTHHMLPIFPAKFAGSALTVLLKND